ncbi:LysR family transcriptional regulator [Pseudomonadota bacterium]
MKTEDLILFTTVAEYKSQSAAARALGIPVSKVSRHIAQLEQHLGTRLLERTTRSLSLTDAGIELLERSKVILAEVEALEMSVGQLQAQPQGIVTVAAPLDFIIHACSKTLPLLYERYPALRLKFISYQSRQNPMDVQADLVLYINHGTPPDSSMVGHELVKVRRSFIASPGFVAQAPDLIHPKQLNQYPCLLTAKGFQPANMWLWNDNNCSHSVEVSGPFESESVELCIAGAINSQGVAWVPPIMCLEHLKTGRLQLLFDGQYSSDVNLWGLYSSRHYLPHRVRVVLDFFQQQFAQIQKEVELI